MGARVVLAAIFVVLAAPGTASAATVRVVPLGCDRSGYCSSEVRFVAPPGEVNDVSMTVEPDRVLVTDAGAPLSPDRGCRPLDAHAAMCGSGAPDAVLGDGDDRLQVLGPAIFASINAGPGADVVVGSDGDDHIVAGAGADVVSGGRGHDSLFDGVRVAFEADVYDGGTGIDWVSWEGRRRSVAATLGAEEPAGSRGEGDRLVAVESLIGGERRDLLRGDAGANRLLGGAGADSLAGGPGNDQLEGGRGDDVLRGESGADLLFPSVESSPGQDAVRGGSDRLLCGAGPDRALSVRAVDRVADECERVAPLGTFDTFDLLLPLASLSAPIARLRAYLCIYGDCRLEMTVQAGDRLLGRRRARVRRALSYARRVPLRLSPEGRRILRRAGRLRATIRFSDHEYSGAWSVVLRAPP
jgi:hypothetical protein